MAMDFSSWEPLYNEILDDLGFSKKNDIEAAEVLAGLLRSKAPLSDLSRLIGGKTAFICGNAPSLIEDLDEIDIYRAQTMRVPFSCCIIAADGAVSGLLSRGIMPHVIVTDLDGEMRDIIEANDKGSIVVVHGHGDNIDKLREYVPRLSHVVGTVQCAPPLGLYNFGGFTDGDRCVFLAQHFQAREVKLFGFDFDDPSVTPRKRKKLLWARRLIEIANR
jgi:uncharacterized Rossmann fold enzyme